MKTYSAIIFTGLLVTFFIWGCKNKNEKDKNVILALSEGLVNSNQVLINQNSLAYHAFEEYSSNPMSKESMGRWYPKVLLIRSRSRGQAAYLDSLINLTEKKGFSKFTKLELDDLFDTIAHTTKELLGVDNQIEKQFSKDFKTLYFPFTDSFSRNAAYDYFSGESSLETRAMLRKFKNSTLISEYNLVKFCDNNVIKYSESFEIFSSLVGINSKVFQTGDTVEINAGVGSFSLRSDPHFFFGAQEIMIDKNTGTASYKFFAKGKPGNYSLPLVIKYNDDNGSPGVKVFEIGYRIK